MEVKLTTDWILMSGTETYCQDGQCYIKAYDADFNFYLMELALKTMNVKYKCEEYFDKNDKNWERPWFEYSFNNIEDIKESCPELYAEFQSLLLRDSL